MKIIGVDGGGTKTRFGLFDEAGALLKECILPTCHFMQVGYEGCANVIREGIQTLKPYDEDVMVSIGIAGYGSDEDVRISLENALSEALTDIPFILTNDMHIACVGALNGDDGVVVNAGTGSIGYALKGDLIIRCSGFGYELGDEGSGYWLGKKALQRFTLEVDGRREKDELYDIIMQHFHLTNPYQIITMIHHDKQQRMTIASLAKLLMNLEACQDLVIEASKEVALIANTLLKKCPELDKVSYQGSLFENALYLNTFKEEVKGNVVAPLHDALYGAYLLAIKKRPS